MKKQNNFSISLKLEKLDLLSQEDREAELIGNNKITTPIKKELRKRKKIPNGKRKWGYVKDDFIYYGPKKHVMENQAQKEKFLVRIPLNVCMSHA